MHLADCTKPACMLLWKKKQGKPDDPNKITNGQQHLFFYDLDDYDELALDDDSECNSNEHVGMGFCNIKKENPTEIHSFGYR